MTNSFKKQVRQMQATVLPQQSKDVAIVGATGAVGREFLDVLDKLHYPIKSLKLLASKRSAGKKIKYKGKEYIVEELNEKSFEGVDVALFSAGGSISKKFKQAVVDSNCVMVDNSSAFRMHEGVPLVVPEINSEEIQNNSGVIANPNCSTIIMLMAVYPLHQKYAIKRIVVSTYQAASGAGWAAMEELKESSRATLEGKAFTPKELPFRYGFNLFSHNAPMQENGYNQEEMKMIQETHKILNDASIMVTATCVRVPVLRAHSESINVEFVDKAPSVEEARDLLRNFPGVKLVDDREKNYFPMPIDASEEFDCLVGRLRQDLSNPNALDLFVAGDQLLKGAALNAVQIACYL